MKELKVRFILSNYTILFFAIGIISCGNDVNFKTGKKGIAPKSEDAIVDNSKEVAIKKAPKSKIIITKDEPQKFYKSITWNSTCDIKKNSAQQISSKHKELRGNGIHEIDKERIKETGLNISGQICSPQKLLRDIVFVLDVSGSMKANDDIINGTCGRLQAVKSMIGNLYKSGLNRFGIVIFASESSYVKQMYTTEQELFAEIGKNGKLEDFICGNGYNNLTTDFYKNGYSLGKKTNYNAALADSIKLLKKGRDNATKEIYLISDGIPTLELDESINLAANIKKNGITINNSKHNVSIATILLNVPEENKESAEEILGDKIVSKDTDGSPLFSSIKNPSDIEAALENLGRNKIEKAVLEYRYIGSSESKFINLFDHMLDNDYSVSFANLNIEDTVKYSGIFMSIIYTDTHENTTKIQGVLNWESKE